MLSGLTSGIAEGATCSGRGSKIEATTSPSGTIDRKGSVVEVLEMIDKKNTHNVSKGRKKKSFPSSA
jgi:hypothetical protein